MFRALTQMASFVIDPIRDGIANALWFFVTGTPTVTDGRFVFKGAHGLVRADLKYGRFEFPVRFDSLVNQLIIEVSGVTGGPFTDGELIDGVPSGAEATYTSAIDSTHFLITTGGITAGDVITGQSSGATATVVSVTQAGPGVLEQKISFGLENVSMGGAANGPYIAVVANPDTNAFELWTTDRYGIQAHTPIPGDFVDLIEATYVIEWFDGEPIVKLSRLGAGQQFVVKYTKRSGIAFQDGEIVEDVNSTNTAIVLGDDGKGNVRLQNLSGDFTVGGQFTGLTSGAFATATAQTDRGFLVMVPLVTIKRESVPTVPLNLFVNVEGSDDQASLAYILVDNANQNSIMLV